MPQLCCHRAVCDTGTRKSPSPVVLVIPDSSHGHAEPQGSVSHQENTGFWRRELLCSSKKLLECYEQGLASAEQLPGLGEDLNSAKESFALAGPGLVGGSVSNLQVPFASPCWGPWCPCPCICPCQQQWDCPPQVALGGLCWGAAPGGCPCSANKQQQGQAQGHAWH